MTRIFNFSAGPAVLPETVLEQAAAEMLDWEGHGCSVMEMSHRSSQIDEIIVRAEADLRALLGLSGEYCVLFLQGGATLQFAQIPMNLLAEGSADYLVTGAWSHKAFQEAQRLAPCLGGTVRLAGSTVESGFDRFVPPEQIQLDPKANYLHLCTNESIHGVELFCEQDLPQTSAPLIADVSSHFLSRPIDMNRYGMIYAGAQKNAGPAGLTIVVIHADLLGRAWTGTPSVMNYQSMVKNSSRLNTPPTYAIYVSGLVLQWLRHQGGLEKIEANNREKANLLYECIDASQLYVNSVDQRFRSRMNVPFLLRDERLNDVFLEGARQSGLVQLKGHKSVGGMRASIYNAMPLAGVQALVAFMQAFEQQHG